MILEARCELEEDDPRQLAQRMQKHWIVKKASQPMGHQSAGCVFRNPRGVGAGKLIAEPECTSQDVLRLIDLIRGQVRDRMGVELELELEIW